MLRKAKALSLSMLEEERLTSVPTGVMTKRARRPLRRFPPPNVRILEACILKNHSNLLPGHFHGSVFVSIHARVFLQNLLSESKFEEDLEHIVRCFDKTTKPRFRNAEEPQYVKFGSTRDNDQEAGIRFGQLKLSGSDVAQFFEPSITCIVDAVKRARKDSKYKILVGFLARYRDADLTNVSLSFCSMSCWLGVLLRAIGCTRKFMKGLSPLDSMSLVRKTMCKRSNPRFITTRV